VSKSIGIFDASAPAVSASDLFNQIAAGVSLVNGQTLGSVGSETLTISRKHAGFVIVLICILLFPIGLLALLARQTETITVTAKESDAGVVASVNGRGDARVVDFLADLLAAKPSG